MGNGIAELPCDLANRVPNFLYLDLWPWPQLVMVPRAWHNHAQTDRQTDSIARLCKNFLPPIGHFVWQSYGASSDISGFRQTFQAFVWHFTQRMMLDILSDDPRASCQTFSKFVRHVWRDWRISRSLNHCMRYPSWYITVLSSPS